MLIQHLINNMLTMKNMRTEHHRSITVLLEIVANDEGKSCAANFTKNKILAFLFYTFFTLLI